MIFDAVKVTEELMIWQHNRDDKLLESIIDDSRSLIEVIVSKFDYNYRDDLIQESITKLQYSMLYYNPKLGSLHNYFTTVIKNACITFISKQAKEPTIEYEIDDELEIDWSKVDQSTMLEELIQRNRVRFPSLPVEFIDGMTEYIYNMLIESTTPRKFISQMVEMFSCNRTIATIVYQSTLIYLRNTYKDYGRSGTLSGEFTLAYDLDMVLGVKQARLFKMIFSGMYMRLP